MQMNKFANMFFWARHGFDGGLENRRACRGAVGLVKKPQIVIGNDHYAMAA